MDGWLDGGGWVDGWMDEWMDGWMNGWMDGCGPLLVVITSGPKENHGTSL